jgi:acetylornithine deacetylase/succinyl-diaminopimelate desuccinylase-like protein
MTMLDKTLDYAHNHRDEFLNDLLDYLRIPTISAQPQHIEDIRRGAAWLHEHLSAIGFDSRVLPTNGHPVVYAEWMHKPNAPTVLIYGHYDVQPADPFELWRTPPFDPTIRDGVIYARGSDDNKGQHLAHIKACESWLKATGELPVNVKFIVEGEEEIGGPNLGAFVESNKLLLGCDCVLISDSALFNLSQPTIVYGLRGLTRLEVHVKTVSRDLHSGHYGGNVQNPLVALSQIVSRLKDDKGRVAVPGFYDEVRELSSAEREDIARVPYSVKDMIAETGASDAFGDPDFTVNERKGARPTLEINGMWGGYTGLGGKTIIPSEAHCKITCRLVPHMNPQRTQQIVADYIKQIAPPATEVSVELFDGNSPAVIVDRHASQMKAAIAASEATYGNAPFFELEGGTIGAVSDFQHSLGKPVVMLGFGLPDDAIHSPNEKFPVACYEKGIEFGARFLNELRR